MSISDEIRKLQELHETGVLSDEEFAQAKARVIGGQDEPESPPALEGHFERLHLQNELERIDREWEMERRRYVTRDRNGNAQEPSAGGAIGAVIGGIVVIGFLIFWTQGASSIGAPPVFAVFGIFGIGIVVVGVIAAVVSAGQYQSAHDRYQQRRSALLAKLKEQDRTQAR